MRSLLKVWAQEYRNIFSDYGVLLIFYGAVILYPIFYPIPYANEVLKETPVAVVDLDQTEMSRQVVRMLDAHELIRVATRPTDMAEAQQQFYERKVYGIILIPKDFERTILRGDQGSIVNYADASYFLIYRQVLTGISETLGTLSAGIQVKQMMAKGLLQEQAMATAIPLPLISFPLFNPSGGYASYIVPPVLILILQQTLLIGIGMLGGTAREYSSPHYLCVAQNRSNRVLPLILGKAGAYFSLYILHSVYFFGVLFRFYHFPQRGDLLAALCFILPYLLAVIFLGMAIASLFRVREVAIMVLLFSSIPILFLSGFAWPAGSIPGWLFAVAHLIPSTAGIDGFMKLYQMGATMHDVLGEWFLLWGLAALYFILAWMLWSRLMKRGQGVNSLRVVGQRIEGIEGNQL